MSESMPEPGPARAAPLVSHLARSGVDDVTRLHDNLPISYLDAA